MGRLTISLPDDLHRALKESAARRGTTIGELVAESLEYYGVKTRADAREIVKRARDRSDLQEEEAIDLAVSETEAARSS